MFRPRLAITMMTLAALLQGGWVTAQQAEASEPKKSTVPVKTAPPKAKAAGQKAPPKKPAPKRKKNKRSSEINPCMTPDPGWGYYERWSNAPSMGKMLMPKRGGVTPSGGFDLIVHFHGRYPIRKEFVRVARGMVLVAMDLGVSSGPYGRAFSSPQTFRKLLKSVEREVARKTGKRRAFVRRLALSSWSAGYGAIGRILRQPLGKKVDALILLDSVYAGYLGKSKALKAAPLKPFVAFARQAARRRKFMFQSHSSIQPPGYASTGEVSEYIVQKLGGRMRRSRRADRYGLDLYERFDRGHYHVRGYRGRGKPDHCAHLGLMRDVLRVHLNRRWRSPRARPGKRKKVSKARELALRHGHIHTVKRGEHLIGIARSHGTSVTAVRRLNGLKKGRPIRVGQELLLPPKDPSASRKTKTKAHKNNKGQRPADRPLRPGHKIHVVAEDQTLGSIARRYRITVATIRKANDLRRRQPIRPGQRLVIPPPPPKKKRRPKRRSPSRR